MLLYVIILRCQKVISARVRAVIRFEGIHQLSSTLTLQLTPNSLEMSGKNTASLMTRMELKLGLKMCPINATFNVTVMMQAIQFTFEQSMSEII